MQQIFFIGSLEKMESDIIKVKDKGTFAKTVKTMFETVKTSYATVFYLYKKYSVIITLNLIKESKFRDPILKSYYQIGLLFQDASPITDSDKQNIIKGILTTMFGDTSLIWEHAPFSDTGVVAAYNTYYLFISIPYGYKPVTLTPIAAKELTDSFCFLYDPKTKKEVKENV